MKKYKKPIQNNTFKISALTWNEELELLMDHILLHIFKIILKKHGEKTDNLSIRMYINKIESRLK